ncbi:disease resistance protein RPV1 isoform X2 [Malus domestica]|uniref:disease resistance protein RPV1 isoform X2 n=1 Tax=Malus domestica TaxID=3750 RepID=UPI0039771238
MGVRLADIHLSQTLRKAGALCTGQISLDCMFLQSQQIIDYSLLLGLHFRAPEDLKGFSQPPPTMHNHESLPADDGVTLQGELLIPPKGLLLVTHEPGSVSTAPGPHIRGSPLKAYSLGDKEVNLLLPGTGRCDRSMVAFSSSGPQWKYEVFINFRGEDTRKGFVSHLYRALRQKTINIFIDAQELGKGDRLSELLTAIRESRLSIVVFSQNYASSTWCLKELVEILKCKDTKEPIVLPIFYEVDPSDVRKLKRKFAEAFDQHDHDSNVEMEEVQSWRSALTTATSLSGWDSRNYEEDAKLIEEIVEDVFRKLRHISSTPCKDNGLVEMDSHMHEMHLRLQPGPPGVELGDVRIVGIWGMGGLGKTTIARAVYDEIACRFEACCFLENVKVGFRKHGEQHMQTQLLSSISGKKVESFDILKNGFQVMLKSLGHKKVLLVVDDVDKLAQIEALLGKEHSFGGGSRIIITTRDWQLLSGANAIYSPKVFNDPGVELGDVRIVGIWGMGGLGKTTIARAVYDEIAYRFEACCFLENVKVGFMKHGELDMQTQLLSCISGNKVENFDILKNGFQVMLKRLGHKKVLVVVDDVDKLAQIEALLGKEHSFGGGSRIIITTRDAHLLSGADAIYGPKILSDDGALELFRWYAFRTNQPTKDYDDLTWCAVKYAQGLPLALKVLGAFLHNKTVREWEDVLEKIRKIPRREIHDVLKTSFDGLDDTEKDIFLDIACFFKGMDKEMAIEILDGCGLYPHPGIRVLIERALITVSVWGRLEMHDSLQEMGREIVRQQSIIEPGRRSRLCSYEDVCHVLTQNTGTKAVESIDLRWSKSDEVSINAEAFDSMIQLRLLRICHSYGKQPLIGHLKFLSRELRYLSWAGYPLMSLPSNFQFKNLVDLDMQFSRIKRLWEGTQTLGKLKFINLSNCKLLEETPDFTKVPNLERLIFESCRKLVEVHPCILTLTNLVCLDLRGCYNLRILPSSIRMQSLETLDLTGCSNLGMFPEILEDMKEISGLDLSGSKIKELPSSINNLTGLRYLNLKDCMELKSLPSICMRSLNTLDLSGCWSLEMFPDILEVMEELPKLNLSGSKIKELPSSIDNLTGLRYLNLKDCKELKSLPSVIHMKSLITLDLSGCSSLEMFPEIFEVMEKLKELNLSGSKLKELPSSINNLTGLRFLNLSGCKELKSLPSVIHMRSLTTLDLSGCSSLEMFPEIFQVMAILSELNLSGSKLKELPSSVNILTGLGFLSLKDCKELKSLPSVIHMRSLKTLDLSGCSSLEMFPEIFEGMEKLEELNLSESKLKELSSSINNLTGLRFLNLSGCKELKSLPSIIHMKSLITLDLSGCSSLEMFPEIFEVMEKLKELNFSGSKLKELPLSINNLTGLRFLSLKDCKELKSLPSVIHMRSLKTLDLSGCSSPEMFLEIFEGMEKLEELNLSGSKLKELSSSINNLAGLRYLILKDCKELKSFSSVIHMRSLKTLDLSGCSSLEMFPKILEVMKELHELNLSGSNLKELPSSINNLTGLRFLNLSGCKELKSLPSVIHMKSLITLDLSGCSSLEMFPEIFEVMEKFKELNLSGSKLKELPSSINNLTGLRFLDLSGCKELKSLPSVIHMRSLKTLDLSGCSSLEMDF